MPINKPKIIVIIPAYNEEKSIGKVINDIPKNWVELIIVGNNNSTDHTSDEAKKAGAIVVDAKRKGYGYACLKAMDYVSINQLNPDIIVFLDGDYSDHPDELPQLVQPIIQQDFDLVIGSRALGKRVRGSMMPQQIFGNWLATHLLRLIYKIHFTDLGPFRAIKWEALQALNMQDKTYGWTVEMQLKAAKQKMKTTEVPVSYRHRIGVSKVSGTVKGTIMAGYKIIATIFKYW